MKKFFRTAVIVFAAVFATVCFRAEISSFIDKKILGSDKINWEEYSDSPLEIGSRYKNFFEPLSSDQKKAYNNILSSITECEDAFPEKIEVPFMTGDELTEVFEAVIYDNPTVICFGRDCKILTREPYCWFEPSYTMSLSTFREKTQELENRANEIVCLAEKEESEFAKELVIHDYIIENCSYDESLSHSSSMTYSCIVDGIATCEGYAKAAKLLLEKAGIECVTVVGSAETQEGGTECHMWNEVKINGEYYHLDVTWDDPEYEHGDAVSHIYMNVTDEEIGIDHSDFSAPHKCESEEANYFCMTGKYFTSFGSQSKEKLKKLIKESADSGMNCVEIKFSSYESYDKAIRKLIKNGEAYSVIGSVNQRYSLSLGTQRMEYSADENRRILELIY